MKHTATKHHEANWAAVSGQHTGNLHATDLHDNTGILIKAGPNYSHCEHHLNHSRRIVVIDGDFSITEGGITTTYTKGDYFVISAHTPYSTASKAGFLIASFGDDKLEFIYK